MSWLVIVGAVYLVVSTAFLLAMCRAAAVGDSHRRLRRAHPHSGPHPSDGPRTTAETRPLDFAS